MKSTARTVGAVMIIMVASRLMSLLSNMAYITFFGINLETEIYSYAIQLPNIIFNSFGTALVTVVIPIFAGYIGIGEKERAFRFADNITGLSLVLASTLSLAGVLLAPFILLLTRFRNNGFDFALTALRVMFPVMIFYALSFIFQGVLQSLGRFDMPAMVSVPSSLVVIIYVFALGGKYGVRGLIIATFIGLSLQALVLIPPLFRTGYYLKPSFNYRDEDIVKALKLVPPVLIGTCAYQFNMLFNATLAANYKDAVAIITTVQNLILYAVLAFIYSVTSVIFPRLTMLAARNDMKGFKDNVLKVFKFLVYFLAPAAAGFIAVRHQLIDFLYGWGRVTAGNVRLAGNILALYSIGAVGIGLKEVADRAFYSLRDTKKPAFNGVIIMMINVAAALVLTPFMGVQGIPLAYSVSALAGALALMMMMRRKIGPFGGKKLLLTGFKVAAASVIMLIAIVPLAFLLDRHAATGQAVLDKGIRLFAPSAAGAVVYCILTCLMKVDEALIIKDKIARRLSFSGK